MTTGARMKDARREKIEEAQKKATSEYYDTGINNRSSISTTYSDGFEDGAQWADSHPDTSEIEELRKWGSEYKDLSEKWMNAYEKLSRKSQAAEVAKMRELLQRAMERLRENVNPDLHQNLFNDYAALKKELG